MSTYSVKCIKNRKDYEEANNIHGTRNSCRWHLKFQRLSPCQKSEDFPFIPYTGFLSTKFDVL